MDPLNFKLAIEDTPTHPTPRFFNAGDPSRPQVLLEGFVGYERRANGNMLVELSSYELNTVKPGMQPISALSD